MMKKRIKPKKKRPDKLKNNSDKTKQELLE